LKPVVLKVFDAINELYFTAIIGVKRKELLENNKLYKSLDGERILVLAPHVDDDIIGCGGAILKYLAKGKKVFIAYVTDSGKRGREGYSREEIKNERKHEAIKVGQALGLVDENLFFLNGMDGDLINSNITEALTQAIEAAKPDTIFLPVLLDTHADHFGVTDKLCAFYEQYPQMLKGVRLYLYESQSPITQVYSNISLDITDWFQTKKELLSYYKSQGGDFRFITSLNKINGLLFGGKTICEVFISTNMDKYYSFYKKYFKDYNAYLDIKKNLVANHDSRYLIKSYKSSMKYKKLLKKLI